MVASPGAEPGASLLINLAPLPLNGPNDLNQADRELSKLLIGNKADLEAQRMVSRAEAEDLAQQIGAIYFETSIAIETLPFGRLQVRGGRGIFKALRILVEDLMTEK